MVILVLEGAGRAVAADGHVPPEDLALPPFVVLGEDFGDGESRRPAVLGLVVRRGVVYLHVGLL